MHRGRSLTGWLNSPEILRWMGKVGMESFEKTTTRFGERVAIVCPCGILDYQH